MRIKAYGIFAFFCLLITIFVLKGISNTQEDPYPNIKIPVINGAYNVKIYFNHPKATKSLNYYVRAEYPANEVIRFYDSEFKQNGWIACNGKAKREWECFIDGTIASKPLVRQFLALWVHPILKKEAFLALRYVRIGDKWSNELHVICQVQPLSDRTRLESFMKKLDKDGGLSKFMNLINSYRMANGQVNIDKAIKENPENHYLKEYKRILDEIK